ncbi:ABC transporter permease [Sinomicrobium weinanense]|uniref:ABC transporter permease n=1 Tax=Sinomicrobium weinanense TaxID=2842200 RepID=A0A926JRL1_9FLAO|nr:ABC transporter permease [Sinomicrobium weinanense]MBC9796008.1 ABC transporter permease [Sinomicrobium weinanense]MBU3123173.1 ABC transporter permease [Sinomicrobium weinanense]
MKNFFGLLQREFRLFWKNKVLRLLFIGAPVLYGVLLGYVYSKGKVTDLPVIVVDEDQSDLSRKAIQMFEDNEVLNVSRLLFDQNNIGVYAIEDEAACVVLIPRGFEKKVFTKKHPEVTTIVNTSSVLTANYASTAIQLCLGTMKAGIQIETLKKQGVPERIAMTQYEPFQTTFIKKYNRSTNYMYFLWPGVLATVLQQVLLLGLALSFAAEYENGTFRVLLQRCPSTLKLILVKVLPYLLMSIGIWGLYMLFAWWFRMPLKENMVSLTLITGIFTASVSFIGILFSVLIPSQLKATEVLMVVATPSFILSGFTWPLSQMPVWVQAIANCIPLTHYLKVLRVLIVENGSVSQTTGPIWAMVLIGGVCGIGAFIALSIKGRKVMEAEERPA